MGFFARLGLMQKVKSKRLSADQPTALSKYKLDYEEIGSKPKPKVDVVHKRRGSGVACNQAGDVNDSFRWDGVSCSKCLKKKGNA